MAGQSQFIFSIFNSLLISYLPRKHGFEVAIFSKSKKYSVTYPSGIFENLSEEARNIIAENYVYARTRPLKLMADKLIYDTGEPFLRKFVDYGILEDMSRVSDIKRWPTKDLLEKIKESGKGKIIFKKKKSAAKLIPAKPTSPQKAILALSFGKDSLLSYGLAKEIGLECEVAFDLEMERSCRGEWAFKRKILKSFVEEEGEKLHFFRDNVDEFFYNHRIKSFAELENTNAMLAFALNLIPIAYFRGARYLIFGNERNLDDFYFNKYGFKTYPSADQTSEYTKNLNYNLKLLTEDNIETISLVESIYNLAEIKILYNRYPHLLKYMMSCSPPVGSVERWCYHCPMCAKAFLYSVAVGGDPSRIGFKENFFTMKQRSFYPLFAENISRPYEKPPQVKEEQLLAFLLAYRLGCRGGLIEIFRKQYFRDAVKLEGALRKKYFGIHKIHTIPHVLQPKILKIYRKELKNFQ